MEKVFTDDNFKKEVLDSKIPVMVDFFASWCGPCQALLPIVEELAKEYAGDVKIGKYSVEDNNKYATQYGIMSIPAVKFFKDGEVVDEMIGLGDKSEYEKKLDSLIE